MGKWQQGEQYLLDYFMMFFCKKMNPSDLILWWVLKVGKDKMWPLEHNSEISFAGANKKVELSF